MCIACNTYIQLLSQFSRRLRHELVRTGESFSQMLAYPLGVSSMSSFTLRTSIILLELWRYVFRKLRNPWSPVTRERFVGESGSEMPWISLLYKTLNLWMNEESNDVNWIVIELRAGKKFESHSSVWNFGRRNFLHRRGVNKKVVRTEKRILKVV